MANPIMDPTFAAAVAVDAGNAACRKRGGKPTNSGPWPAEEWNDKEWNIYRAELVRCWRMFDPQIADAMEVDFCSQH